MGVSRCHAGPGALAMIRRAFDRVAASWYTTVAPALTTTYYQYANRLAHAYHLNEANGRPAILAFVDVCSDSSVNGPKSKDQRETIINGVQQSARGGQQAPPYVVDAYVDVTSGTPIAS
jgi:hypothetical protein